jgi:hypothetical protein
MLPSSTSSSSPITTMGAGMFQFSGAKATMDGEALASFGLEEVTVKSTVCSGCEASTTVIRPVKSPNSSVWLSDVSVLPSVTSVTTRRISPILSSSTVLTAMSVRPSSA